MAKISPTAVSTFLRSAPETKTLPSSSISIPARPYFSIMPLITLPPGPMTMPIFAGSILMRLIAGTCLESSFLGESMTPRINFKISRRAPFACSKTFSKISTETPSTLTSICRALTPSSVPAALKSMSPWWSSGPWMSVRTLYFPESGFSSSSIRPIAIPAAGFFIGTPASIRDITEEQTVAMEDEPFDDKISETTRIV